MDRERDPPCGWSAQCTAPRVRAETLRHVRSVPFRAELEAALLEADLVLAMCASRFRDRIYSGARTQDTVRRFTARVDDAAQRQTLEDLFPGDGTLEDRLEQAYGVTEGDRHRFRERTSEAVWRRVSTKRTTFETDQS